jgi:hypothetical protein
MAAMELTRTVAFDIDPAHLHALVGTAEGWRAWLADEVVGVVAAGERLSLVDGDAPRGVLVHSADDGRVAFSWWERDDPSSVTYVELEVVTGDGLPQLQIREVGASADPTAWEVRVTCLWACCVAAALV